MKSMQTMDPDDENSFDFDLLDDTKNWPENLFPLQTIRKSGFNSRNIDHFHMLMFSLCAESHINTEPHSNKYNFYGIISICEAQQK